MPPRRSIIYVNLGRGVASFPSVSADEKNRQNQHMRNKQIFERSKEVGEQPGVGRQSQTYTYVITDDGEMLFGAYLNAIPAKDHSGRGRARAAAALLTHDTRQVQSFSHWTDRERERRRRRLSTESGHLLFCLSSSLRHSEVHSAELLHIAMHAPRD